MFSGIVEEVGTVIALDDSADGRRLKIEAPQLAPTFKLGESVSVSGCCLTVVEQKNQSFVVEAVHETLKRTKLGAFVKGSKVNLEAALRLSDRLGGHIVTGHIDAVGKVRSMVEEGFSRRVTFEVDPAWAAFFIEKGSVSVDGVSLTVAGCDPMPRSAKTQANPFCFNVVLIPHTLEVTTFGTLQVNDPVNIETDMIARYIARWFGADRAESLLADKSILMATALMGAESRASQLEELSWV